jgi:hypothetical protein
MVNNSTNINKTRKHLSLNSDCQQFYQYKQNKKSPSLYSDGQQFYQYQQNKKAPLFKQWLSTILPI